MTSPTPEQATPEMVERVARALYARWCTNCDSSDRWEPEWDKYEAGESLNGGWGLTADNFRSEAEAIAPYDTVENVGRRLCWHHCVCVAFHNACTSPETCLGLEGWQQRTAEAVINAALSALPADPQMPAGDAPSPGNRHPESGGAP